MDSMILQELLILVLSIAALGGGTACIIRRDKRWNEQGTKGDDGHRARKVRFIPQNHTA